MGLLLVSILFGVFFLFFGSKFFKEAMFGFAGDAKVLFLTAVMELGTQGIWCC